MTDQSGTPQGETTPPGAETDETEQEPTREELVRRLDAGRARLAAELDGLDDAALLAPAFTNGWSRRDLLVHLAAWQERIARILTALQEGREPEPRMQEDGTDAFNAAVDAETPGIAPRQAVEREAAAYARVRAVVDAAPDEDLFRGDRWPAWTGGEPFVWWIVGNTFGHLEEHLDSPRA